MKATLEDVPLVLGVLPSVVLESPECLRHRNRLVSGVPKGGSLASP